MHLNDKVIVITGASSGIGALAAQQLSQYGATVVLAARSIDKLRTIGAGIMGSSLLVEMDVSSDASVSEGFRTILQRFGRVDVLINNAGYGKFTSIDDTSLQDYEDMMNVNYLGMVRCIKEVLPGMKAAGAGRIVNIASIAGKMGTAKSSAYTATKHAVIGLSSALRQELHGTGITVSTVNPGPIDTPFFQIADPEGHYVNNVRWFMLKPVIVSEAIVKAVRTGKAEINLPRIAGAGAKLYQLFPGIAGRISARFLNKK